jgi:hypothetical protein
LPRERARAACVSAGFVWLFLTKPKRKRGRLADFVSFEQQARWKGGHFFAIPLFGDCMTDRVLYFQPRKRGGGSSVF